MIKLYITILAVLFCLLLIIMYVPNVIMSIKDKIKNYNDNIHNITTSNNESESYCELAKIIATSMALRNDHSDYVPHCDRSYCQCYGYGGTFTWNDNTYTMPHRDCSCLVSYMLNATSIFATEKQYSSNDFNNSGHIVSSVDIRPLDVLVKSGHVEIIVDVQRNSLKEIEDVKIASAGSHDSIVATSQNGYKCNFNYEEFIQYVSEKDFTIRRYVNE